MDSQGYQWIYLHSFRCNTHTLKSHSTPTYCGFTGIRCSLWHHKAICRQNSRELQTCIMCVSHLLMLILHGSIAFHLQNTSSKTKLLRISGRQWQSIKSSERLFWGQDPGRLHGLNSHDVGRVWYDYRVHGTERDRAGPRL